MNAAGIMAGAAILMLAVIATAAVIARYSGFYRRELAESVNRELPLDGLRGMAALMVVIYHSALFYTRLLTGKWGDAGSPVLQAFGPGGVLIFFMLTGHLFWSKARVANGKFQIWKLWRGRLYRIAPLYFFSLVCLLLIAAVKNGAQWLTLKNGIPLLHLLPLGAARWQSISGVDLGEINAGVVWTLWYEWRFYFVLPFIVWLAIGRRTFWLALMVYLAVIAGFWFKINLQLGFVFILGMLCPVLLDNERLRSQLRSPVAASVALLATIFMCAWNRDYTLSVLPSIVLAGALFPLFLVVAAGNNIFGFLTHPAIRCLGAISFSLYLLHSVIFYLAVGVMKTAGLTTQLLLYYWPIITTAAVTATLLCAATYRWIESPFLSSRRNATAIAKPRN